MNVKNKQKVDLINNELEKLPIHEHCYFKPESILFSDEVRGLCEKNSCGMYGTSWACPPAVGTMEECKEKCFRYENAFMFTTATEMKNSFDIKGWHEARIKHEKLTDKVADLFRKEYENPLVLSTEGCTLCAVCTYPDSPCRFPERMYPAIEGYGILVTKQAEFCGIHYNNGPNTVTYFSIIFFNNCVETAI
ncbi:MAG: DUF2284 domain-containing protein [Eubacteriaceae bacterium]|nr:DUF2284 domain-containing protein [Eubacteriaceae bacterium]